MEGLDADTALSTRQGAHERPGVGRTPALDVDRTPAAAWITSDHLSALGLIIDARRRRRLRDVPADPLGGGFGRPGPRGELVRRQSRRHRGPGARASNALDTAFTSTTSSICSGSAFLFSGLACSGLMTPLHRHDSSCRLRPGLRRNLPGHSCRRRVPHVLLWIRTNRTAARSRGGRTEGD